MKKFLLLFIMAAFFGIATQAQTTAPKNSDKKEVVAPKEQAPVTEKKSENAAEHKHDGKAACCADKAEAKAAGCGSGTSASAAPKACCASKAAASASTGKEAEKAETKRSRKKKN